MVVIPAFNEKSEMPAETHERAELLAEPECGCAAGGFRPRPARSSAARPGLRLVALDRGKVDHQLAVGRLAHIVQEVGEADLGKLAEHRLPAQASRSIAVFMALSSMCRMSFWSWAMRERTTGFFSSLDALV